MDETGSGLCQQQAFCIGSAELSYSTTIVIVTNTAVTVINTN